jgi:hypothetical protein
MRIKATTYSDVWRKPCQFYWHGLLHITIVSIDTAGCIRYCYLKSESVRRDSERDERPRVRLRKCAPERIQGEKGLVIFGFSPSEARQTPALLRKRIFEWLFECSKREKILNVSQWIRLRLFLVAKIEYQLEPPLSRDGWILPRFANGQKLLRGDSTDKQRYIPARAPPS